MYSRHSSNWLQSSNLICYLLVIHLLCCVLAWQGQSQPLTWRCYPWAWCWKPQGDFARHRECVPMSLCTSQHHVPQCLHTHKNPYCYLCNWLNVFIHVVHIYSSPVCTWHDLHKPVVIDASINTNWIAIGILVITQTCFLLSPKGIVENLPTEFQGEVSQAMYASCKNLLSFTNIS